MTGRRRKPESPPWKIKARQSNRTGFIRGPVHIVHPAILAAESPYQYDARAHEYRVPISRFDDVLAAIETGKTKAIVEFKGALW